MYIYILLQNVRRITAKLTGLETEASEAVEPLQIVQYSVGGHYEPHVDYFGLRPDLYDDNFEDRVATMLFYLSDDFLGQ